MISMLVRKGNHDSILYVIKKFRSVPGKNVLQSIMYFANIKTNMYSFQWNKFGPYSEELKYALDDAIINGSVEYGAVDNTIRNKQQLTIKLTDQGKHQLDSNLDKTIVESVELAHKLLKNKDYRKIGLLASIHYMMKYNDGKTNAVSLWNIIKKLRPDDGFELSDIE